MGGAARAKYLLVAPEALEIVLLVNRKFRESFPKGLLNEHVPTGTQRNPEEVMQNT